MRVLHLITSLGSGGAETQLGRLAVGLRDQGHSVCVVALTDLGREAERLRVAGIRVEGLGMRRGVPGLSALFRLRAILRRWRPDVVQTWLYHADLLGLVACAGSGVPVVWNLRCAYMDFSRYNPLTRQVVRLCALLSRFPAAVVANSRDAVSRHVQLGYKSRTFQIIPNGFDTDAFMPDPVGAANVRERFGLADAPLVGMVARWDPMKDHATFFAMAKMLRESVSDVRFLLCGEAIVPENGELMDLVRNAGLDASVILAGPQGDMPAIMSSLDVLACPSIGESFPNVVGEAMACGTLCVVTDVGDCAEIVGDTGFVVPVGDARAMCERVRQCLSMSSEMRREHSEKARNRVLNRYSIAAMVEKYLQFWKTVPSL